MTGSDDHPKEPLHLRVTIRCLVEDLGQDISDATKPVEDLAHPVCKKFVEMRSQDPEGIEKVQPLTTNATVYTLHAGEERGATWYQEKRNRVWLLASRFHRSGKTVDAYPYFKQLDEDERLFPTTQDFEVAAELEQLTFERALLEDLPPLIETASGEPGQEARGVIGGRVRVGIYIERANGIEVWYLIASMNLDRGDWNPPKTWMLDLIAAAFPDATLDILDSPARPPHRDLDADEVVYCWYRAD